MPRKSQSPSQLMALFLAIAEELGIDSDRDIAALADVGPESVSNWRSGSVREFKSQKFQAAMENITRMLRDLRAQAGALGSDQAGVHHLEIEEGSSPTDLQRQLRNRVAYDYLGHRFLYFEPQGALAWENLIKGGYEQECWLSGVKDCASTWLDATRDSEGKPRGPIARALGFSRRTRARGLDLISLGPGEGGKELLILEALLDVERAERHRPSWLSFVPVDVSLSLLIKAASAGRQVLSDGSPGSRVHRSVCPMVADFEEGPLSFMNNLRTSQPIGDDGLRLILILGNVFGNLRDEETFVRKKLWKMIRKGDLVWLEVGLRPADISSDPLYTLTLPNRAESASEANRRLLLEGPYRRYAAAIGRKSPSVTTRVWLREDDDSARIPGSVNFCHDLHIEEEGRVVTMLYSRRYELDAFSQWCERMGFSVLGYKRVSDSHGSPRVAHLLLQRN